MSKVTRISTYRPKMANQIKLNLIHAPMATYKVELQKLVTAQLYDPSIKKFADKSITDHIDLPSRLSQVCAKQASAMVRSIQEKVKLAEKSHNKQKYQQEILRKWTTKSISIDINSVNIELDSRFIDIQLNKTGSISTHWIKITSFPQGSFVIPFTPTHHMRKLVDRGYHMKTTCLRVNSDGSLGIYFEKANKIKTQGASMGVDMGRNKIITCSTGAVETTHATGIPTKQILDRIAGRKQGSRGHARAKTQLKNQINYSIRHDVPWHQINHVVLEDLSEIKQGNKWGRRHQFWRVAYAQHRIEHVSEENGVRITRVHAAYTSQTCSSCGFKHKNNRSGEKFLCLDCGHHMDADHNAAINIRNRGVYSPSAIII
jgi:transposase